MRKTMKKMVVCALAITMLLGMGTVSLAKQKGTKPTKVTTEVATETTEEVVETTEEVEKVKPISPKIAKVICTASGKLNVSFKGKVKYSDTVKVTITDAEGKEVDCQIKKKNKTSMQISVQGLVKGQKYTLTIEGVIAKNTSEPVTITKTFTAKGMKTACKASKVTVAKKKFITIKVKGNVCYKDATVTVVDEDGNSLEAEIVKKTKGNIKVWVDGLVKGKKYTVTITGVKVKKEKNYSSITKTFVVK